MYKRQDIRQPQIELHTSVKSSDDVQGDVSGQTDTDVTISEERTEQNQDVYKRQVLEHTLLNFTNIISLNYDVEKLFVHNPPKKVLENLNQNLEMKLNIVNQNTLN